MGLPKISIIIPVYNVEKFLERCVESAVFQIYENKEIILIDDGSTDQSGLIADKLAKKYKDVIVFHKPNGGLSDARNFGLEKMSGEYFFFLDSDDYIHPQTLSILYSTLVALNLDIVECQFVSTSKEDISFNKIYNYTVRKDSTKAFIFQNIKWSEHYTIACNKLYRTKKFGNLRFKKGVLNEDEFYINEWLPFVKEIGYVSCQLYTYIQRDDSIMHRHFDIRRAESFNAYVSRLDIIKKYYQDCLDDFLNFLASFTVNKLVLISNQGYDNDNKIKSRIFEILWPIKNLFFGVKKIKKEVLDDLRGFFEKEKFWL